MMLFDVVIKKFSLILRVFLKPILVLSSRVFFSEGAVRRFCTKKMFLQFSQYSQENICVEVSF